MKGVLGVDLLSDRVPLQRLVGDRLPALGGHPAEAVGLGVTAEDERRSCASPSAVRSATVRPLATFASVSLTSGTWLS